MELSRNFEKFPVPALDEVAFENAGDPLASAYLSKLRNRIIVCPTTSPGKGHYVEGEATASMPFESPPEALGQAVWEALLLFRSAPHLKARQKSDWPAYRASSVKSIQAFEEEFVYVSVEAFPSVLRVEAFVPATAARELFVGRFISNACEFEDLGELVHLACRCSLRIAETEYP